MAVVGAVETTPTYSIGGTVSGLSGTLVLQNNGGDDLQITSDGAFTFNTFLTDGSAYSVTIETSPLLQDCTVKNGSGTISGADVTDVSVNCTDKIKTWTDPSPVSNSSTDANYPRVAMNDNGNAVIVWQQDDDSGNTQIFKSEYLKGAWTNPSPVSTNNSTVTDVYSPQVAMDDNGNAVIVWVQYFPIYSSHQVFKSEYRNRTWTNPSLLDNPLGYMSTNPQVAMDDNGNTVIVWERYDKAHEDTVGSSWLVFKSEYRKTAHGLHHKLAPAPQIALMPIPRRLPWMTMEMPLLSGSDMTTAAGRYSSPNTAAHHGLHHKLATPPPWITIPPHRLPWITMEMPLLSGSNLTTAAILRHSSPNTVAVHGLIHHKLATAPRMAMPRRLPWMTMAMPLLYGSNMTAAAIIRYSSPNTGNPVNFRIFPIRNPQKTADLKSHPSQMGGVGFSGRVDMCYHMPCCFMLWF